MTRDDIIRMAREAGAHEKHLVMYMDFDDLERFAALVASSEREAILSKATKAHDVDGNCAIVLVADIRARSTP